MDVRTSVAPASAPASASASASTSAPASRNAEGNRQAKRARRGRITRENASNAAKGDLFPFRSPELNALKTKRTQS